MRRVRHTHAPKYTDKYTCKRFACTGRTPTKITHTHNTQKKTDEKYTHKKHIRAYSSIQRLCACNKLHSDQPTVYVYGAVCVYVRTKHGSVRNTGVCYTHICIVDTQHMHIHTRTLTRTQPNVHQFTKAQ
eukprot:GDKI01007929.1.p3 GENE.GDKI01007929.1~~GDKI01007929.1.p3  ORF type:complete len:130 (-),score=31.25 GDKI01007929.1:1197-1586(-)